MASDFHSEIMRVQISSLAPNNMYSKEHFRIAAEIEAVSRLFMGSSNQRNHEEVDSYLKDLNFNELELSSIMTALRCTATHKEKLPSWNSKLQEAKQIIIEAGENYKTILYGLL